MTWIDRLLHRGRRPERWLVDDPGRGFTPVMRTQVREQDEPDSATDSDTGWPGTGRDR